MSANEQNLQLLQALQCPVCLDTLVAPIYLCRNGHCVCFKCQAKLEECGTCREPGRPLGRCYQFEHVAAIAKVPCKGCGLPFNMDEMGQHVPTCKKLFQCRVCGEWKKAAKEIKEHVLQEHSMVFKVVKSGSKNKLASTEFRQGTSVDLFTIKDDIFWSLSGYCTRTGICYRSVRIVSHDREVAARYKYSLEIVSRDENNKFRVVNEATVLTESETDKGYLNVLIPNAIVEASRQKNIVHSLNIWSSDNEANGKLNEQEVAGPSRPRRACRDRAKPYY